MERKRSKGEEEKVRGRFGKLSHYSYLCNNKTILVMKRFLLIALFGILATSCTFTRTMYGYTITYEIDGVQYTDTDSLECAEGNVPMYVQGKHSISINQADQMSGRSSGYFYVPVYEGLKDCKVNDFHFWPIRTYKVSQFDGHEIKRRK